MSRKAKDIILLTVVLILALSMFAIVIFDAVMRNKPTTALEIYIDETPINYQDKENAAYAYVFSNAILDVTRQLGINSNNKELSELINAIMDAMEKARIPAQKLGSIAKVIDNSSQDIVDFFRTSGEISLEEMAEALSKTKMQHIADFSNSFFATTTLTEDEFSQILYYYMLANATTSYKQAMYKLGKQDYVTFISNTFYLINTLGQQDKDTPGAKSNILQAVIYELGSNYIEILDKVGIDAIATVLGFDSKYQGGDDDKVDKLNALISSISDTIGAVFGIVGYAMREIKSSDIDAIMHYFELEDSKEKDDYLIYIQSIVSKKVLKGMTNCLKYFNEELEMTAFSDKLKDMILDSYLLRKAIVDEEEDQSIIDKFNQGFEDFMSAINYFYDKDISIQDLANMEQAKYNALLKKAKGIADFSAILDEFSFNLVYIWASNLIVGGKL